MDTHLLWSSNCSCTAWRCCIKPMRFTYSSLKTCYSYLRCTFFFSFLTDTFSWRNTLIVLGVMLKQLPVTFPFAILFSTQSAYALSPFLTPHLPFNPPHSRFCSYNMAKIPLQSTNDQQITIFNGLSRPTAYTISWQYWQCPLKIYGSPNFISSSPYPHCSGLNLDLVKYSTTEPYAALFQFWFPLSCLGWLYWDPSTQAPQATELQIYSIMSGLPVPFCSLPHYKYLRSPSDFLLIRTFPDTTLRHSHHRSDTPGKPASHSLTAPISCVVFYE